MEDRNGLDRIITKKELQRLVPYTPQHIARLEKAGRFPKRVQLGPNRVGWIESEVKAWLEEIKRKRNGNGGAADAIAA